MSGSPPPRIILDEQDAPAQRLDFGGEKAVAGVAPSQGWENIVVITSSRCSSSPRDSWYFRSRQALV